MPSVVCPQLALHIQRAATARQLRRRHVAAAVVRRDALVIDARLGLDVLEEHGDTGRSQRLASSGQEERITSTRLRAPSKFRQVRAGVHQRVKVICTKSRCDEPIN